MRRVASWLVSQLSRVTSSGRFVPEIDGLRFVAIASVLFFHTHWVFFSPEADTPGAWKPLIHLMLQGWFGVQLFFIISGLILSMPFAEHHLADGRSVGLGKYYIRRLTRLEPPYIINLTLLLLLMVYCWGGDLAALTPHYFASMGYSHNFVYHEWSSVNEVTWTLEIEAQFYLLAPLLATVFMLPSKWLRRGIIVAGIVGATWLEEFASASAHSDFLHRTIATQIRYFLIGFLLADVYVATWRGKPAKGLAWDLVGLGAWLAVPSLLDYSLAPYLNLGPTFNGYRMCAYLLPAALLVAYIAVFRGRLLNRLFCNRWLVTIGGMCYTIYLYHTTLIRLLQPHLPDLGGSLWLGLAVQVALLLVVVAISSAMFWLFEKPFMRKDWPQRSWQKVRQWSAALIPQPPVPAPVIVEEPAEFIEDAKDE